jgi:uncharacterized protein YegJ (DUF2314 family)
MATCGCNKSGADAHAGVVHVHEDDAEMAAARDKARSTVDEFIHHLAEPQPGMTLFAVKKPYPTRGDSFEHIWVEVSEYRDGSFYGTIGNDPVDIEGLVFGSAVTVLKSEISDWLILTENGQLGGYTIALLNERAGN